MGGEVEMSWEELQRQSSNQNILLWGKKSIFNKRKNVLTVQRQNFQLSSPMVLVSDRPGVSFLLLQLTSQIQFSGLEKTSPLLLLSLCLEMERMWVRPALLTPGMPGKTSQPEENFLCDPCTWSQDQTVKKHPHGDYGTPWCSCKLLVLTRRLKSYVIGISEYLNRYSVTVFIVN